MNAGRNASATASVSVSSARSPELARRSCARPRRCRAPRGDRPRRPARGSCFSMPLSSAGRQTRTLSSGSSGASRTSATPRSRARSVAVEVVRGERREDREDHGAPRWRRVSTLAALRAVVPGSSPPASDGRAMPIPTPRERLRDQRPDELRLGEQGQGDDAAAGCLLVGGGVIALALLPEPKLVWTLIPQALAGVGMGMALPSLAGGLLPERDSADAASLLTLATSGSPGPSRSSRRVASHNLDDRDPARPRTRRRARPRRPAGPAGEDQAGAGAADGRRDAGPARRPARGGRRAPHRRLRGRARDLRQARPPGRRDAHRRRRRGVPARRSS